VIYICLEGPVNIESITGTETFEKGETILLPASLDSVLLHSLNPSAKLLEVYIGE
jgi:mannose-6-phosphate isomerase